MTKLYEEVNPSQYTAKGLMDVDDANVRDNINAILTNSLMSCTLTPYIALEKARKVLAYFHIFLPGVPFMEGSRGVQVFDVEQYGLKYGMKNDGHVVNLNTTPKDLTHGAHKDGEKFNSSEPPETKDTDEKFSVYFEYKQNEKGLFDVFCEVVTQDELEDLLDDAEEDNNTDSSEYDREERLDEASDEEEERYQKFIKGRRIAGSGSTNEIKAALKRKRTGPGSGTIRRKDKEELKRRGEKLDEIKLVGDVEQPTNSQAEYLSRQSRTPNVTGPTGAIKHVGTPSGIPSRSDLESAAARSTTHSGEETPGTKINPRDAIDRINKMPEPKPMSSQEMQKGSYSQKIQETSHESVNYVRRLGMKNSKKKV